MSGLTSIEIPASVKKIGARAFAGNNFSSITVPKGVTEIKIMLSLPRTTSQGRRGMSLSYQLDLYLSVDMRLEIRKSPKLSFQQLLRGTAKERVCEGSYFRIRKTEAYSLVTKVYVG